MDKPLCIICDLDGTLAHIDHRDPYDASKCEDDVLNTPVADVLKRYSLDTTIILLSGRMDKWQPETERWLKKHDIVFHHLFMRKTDDFRKDSIIKREIFEKQIQPHWDVFFILDDRNQVVNMWRELGLTCFQVAPGDF